MALRFTALVFVLGTMSLMLRAGCAQQREPVERMEVRNARDWATAHFPDVAVGVTCGPHDDWGWSVCDISVAGEFVAVVHCSSDLNEGCNRLGAL